MKTVERRVIAEMNITVVWVSWEAPQFEKDDDVSSRLHQSQANAWIRNFTLFRLSAPHFHLTDQRFKSSRQHRTSVLILIII